jgi:hypothetical protein
MTHAVGVIRDEEDRLGGKHHIVAVQGNSWTSNIGFYDSNPIAEDNVVYEVHGYPPPTQSYTYANLPVIIGEYGTLSNNGTAFFNDLESKAISSLARDYQPFSDCSPDLVSVTHSAGDIQPNASGKLVQAYLLGHAQ